MSRFRKKPVAPRRQRRERGKTVNDKIEFVLTAEERRAIDSLKRLAKKWPKSLWLFSASGSLEVMRCDESGDHAMDGEGVDPRYIVASIQGIPNDGGDW